MTTLLDLQRQNDMQRDILTELSSLDKDLRETADIYPDKHPIQQAILHLRQTITREEEKTRRAIALQKEQYHQLTQEG